jgi:D-alanyl-lipoteichoic acid acyltransferase DltB (MBOAT superfamily)
MNVFYLIIFGLMFLYVYWLVAAHHRRWVIIVGSVTFLLTLSWKVAIIHLVLALFNFKVAKKLSKSSSPKLLWATISINVTVILLQTSRANADDFFAVSLSLSYFTLMNLGYLLEVYKKQTDVVESFANYYLFSSFYPCLLMGPIEKTRSLLPQLLSLKERNWHFFSPGYFLISLGFFKKFVISDRILDITHPRFNGIETYLGFELWLFYFLCLIQIYCDFSGYIDLARGFAQLMGIKLLENFNRPYLANSIANIWQRWNITLVDWLKNHVYLPVLMSTKNIYLASILIMSLVAIWHRQTSLYIAWAIYWSILYSIHIFLRMKGKSPTRSKFASVALMILTMTFSSIFFQAKNNQQFITAFINSFKFFEFSHQLQNNLSALNLIIIITGVSFVVLSESHIHQKKTTNQVMLTGGLALVLNVLTIAFHSTGHYVLLYMKY